MPRGRQRITWQCDLLDGHDAVKTYASRWAYRRHLCLVHGYELITCQTENGVWYDDLRPLQGARLWQLRDMYRRGQRHRSRSRQQPESQPCNVSSRAAVSVSTAASPPSPAAVTSTSTSQLADTTAMPPSAQPAVPVGRSCRVTNYDPIPAVYLSDGITIDTRSELEADLSSAQLALINDLDSGSILRRCTSTLETDEDLNEIYRADVGFPGNILPDLFSPVLDTTIQDSNNNDLCASVIRSTSEISVVRGDVMVRVVPSCMLVISVEPVHVNSVATASLFTAVRGPTTHSVGVQADAASGDWRIQFRPSLASEILHYYLHADPVASASSLAIRTMRALNLHPTDWVSFEIIEAIAVGIIESDRLSARNQLSLLASCMDNQAMGMFALFADIHRRLARSREPGGTSSPAEVVPVAALPEPSIIIDTDEEA